MDKNVDHDKWPIYCKLDPKNEHAKVDSIASANYHNGFDTLHEIPTHLMAFTHKIEYMINRPKSSSYDEFFHWALFSSCGKYDEQAKLVKAGKM